MLRVASVALLFVACSTSDPKPAPTPPAPTPPAATAPVVAPAKPASPKEMIASGAVVIDVRSPEEYAGPHLERATNIPIDQLATRLGDVEKLTGGDKAKPIVVYCASGNRASKAKTQLEANGYTNVVNGGGYDDLAP